MAKYEVSKTTKKLISRLNRVQGQVGAISRMLEAGEDAKKIGIQISAVTSAMQSVQMSFMKIRLIEKIAENMSDLVDSVDA